MIHLNPSESPEERATEQRVPAGIRHGPGAGGVLEISVGKSGKIWRFPKMGIPP